MSDRSRKLFEALVRQNEVHLLACLRTMVRDPGLVDDLFQETLLTAWQRFDQYDQSLPLGPWLRGIAINLARNAARKRKREILIFGESVHAAVEVAMQSIENSDEHGWDEKSAALSDCLTQLPARSRELIRQRYEDSLNAAAIAKVTRSSSSAIRKQLQRIRETLADCVAKKTAGAAR
ncbi:MAG: sigma-70 family RNA polymerase sigma factor [Rubripirellula sp.]